MTFRFHHVHLICSDLERTISFLCEDLGARLVERRKFGTADGATLDLGGVTVNLRVAREEEGTLQDSATPRYGYNHIGVAVDDLDGVYGGLQARGYHFTLAPTIMRGLRIAFFTGPDNILVELVQPEASA